MAKNSTELPSPEAIARAINARQNPGTVIRHDSSTLAQPKVTRPPADLNKMLDEMGGDVFGSGNVQPTAPLASPAVESAEAVQRTVELIQIDMIDEPAVRTRWHYDEKRTDALLASLLDHGKGNILDGQLLPILVFQKADGRYEIVEGLTRVKAFQKSAQGSKIKAIVLDPLSRFEAYHKSYAANDARNEMTDYDKGMSFAAALEAGIFSSQKEIAEKLGVSKQLVSFMLKFSQLDETVRSVIEEDTRKFGANYAQELSVVQDKVSAEKAVFLAKKILEGMPISKLKLECAKLMQEQNSVRQRPRSGSIPTERSKVKYSEHAVNVAYAPSKAMPPELAKGIAEIFAEASRRAEQLEKEFSERETGTNPEQSGT